MPGVTCIIGAGCSGISAAKAFHQRGLQFDCFEKSSEIGGLWVYENPNRLSGAYRGLHINTSKRRMEFSDFSMPDSYPDFPRHTQVREYFNGYVDHFGFRERITFNCEVERAERSHDGSWNVTLSNGEQRRYDALVVANGHHWDPRWPEPPFPGSFSGVEMHSHDYRENSVFAGRNVVVVGMGNSGMDIAVEASQVAARTFLSARRGVWIMPKYLFGDPFDAPAGPFRWMINPRVPFAVRRRAIETVLKTAVGPIERYGLPKPDHRLFGAHPTVSSDILVKLGHGDITPKPNISELQGDRVEFADGTVEPVDVIVYCTGYKITFPFFDPDFISAPDNDLPLFRRVFKPGLPNLFFVGLLQPLGAIMPLTEAQSEWICDYLEGNYVPPSEDEMERDIERERAAMFKQFYASRRHTMEVDFGVYLLDLERERKEGAKRARAAPRGGPATTRSPVRPLS